MDPHIKYLQTTDYRIVIDIFVLATKYSLAMIITPLYIVPLVGEATSTNCTINLRLSYYLYVV